MMARTTTKGRRTASTSSWMVTRRSIDTPDTPPHMRVCTGAPHGDQMAREDRAGRPVGLAWSGADRSQRRQEAR